MSVFDYSLILIALITNIIILLNLDLITRKFNLIDSATNKIHKIDTSKFGFFLFLNINFFLFLFSFFDNFNYEGMYLSFFIFTFLILGFFDDINNLNVLLRFLVSFFLVFFFYLYNPTIFFISKNFPYYLNISLLIIFTLGFIHLVNITDGLNGLVPSLFIYSCIYYILKGYSDYSNLYQFLAILSLIGMLVYIIPNIQGKCFLGNAGSYLVAIIITILYCQLYIKNILEYSDILLIFIIPLLDGIRVTIKRIYLKKNPFKGDLSHLHHIVRPNKKNVLIYFSLIYLPSIVNFLFKDHTIYIGLISIIFYFIFYNFLKKNHKLV